MAQPGWLNNGLSVPTPPKYSIIDVLKRNMAGYEKARSHKTLHASAVTKPDFCPRQYALMDITEKPAKDEYIATALRATFDVGNATADLLREKWAGSAAHGFWNCRRCDHSTAFGPKPMGKFCKDGGQHDWRYVEARFISGIYGISGGIDVFMDLDAPKLFVTELKIIKPEDFDTLVAPLAEHRLRTALYLKIINDDAEVYKERVNLQEAKVLYVSRGYGKKTLDPASKEVLPFREFTVKRDDLAVLPYLNRAKEVKLFREKRIIPQGICATTVDGPAKKCSVCPECFSGKYKAGTTLPMESAA